jgi:hypothetical protein
MMKPGMLKVGDKVTYWPNPLTRPEVETGIVKSLCEDRNHVFVVYNCDGDRDNFANYTAARTDVKHLVKGWL